MLEKSGNVYIIIPTVVKLWANIISGTHSSSLNGGKIHTVTSSTVHFTKTYINCSDNRSWLTFDCLLENPQFQLVAMATYICGCTPHKSSILGTDILFLMLYLYKCDWSNSGPNISTKMYVFQICLTTAKLAVLCKAIISIAMLTNTQGV